MDNLIIEKIKHLKHLVDTINEPKEGSSGNHFVFNVGELGEEINNLYSMVISDDMSDLKPVKPEQQVAELLYECINVFRKSKGMKGISIPSKLNITHLKDLYKRYKNDFGTLANIFNWIINNYYVSSNVEIQKFAFIGSTILSNFQKYENIALDYYSKTEIKKDYSNDR